MAFKVFLLIGGLALLCSFADAKINVKDPVHRVVRAANVPSINEMKNWVEDPLKKTIQQGEALIDNTGKVVKDHRCFNWSLQPYDCTSNEIFWMWVVIFGLMVLFVFLPVILCCIFFCGLCTCAIFS